MKFALYVIASLLFSIEIVFAIDFFLHSRKRHLKVTSATIWLAVWFSLTLFCCRNIFIGPFVLAIGIPAVVLLAFSVCFRNAQKVCRELRYACQDNGKSSIYAGKKVMVIVPHEDDDMNIASGVLEQFVRYGSEVYVVFVTNGDYWDIAEVRLTEAIRALHSVGIPEDHVIFLGYADGWATDAPHIYNAAEGALCKSRNGYSATYALKSHPAWNEGNPYTSSNLLEDMQSVILNHRPDVILCSDYDAHVEHKATTLAFEKALGQILKQEDCYQPVALKAFAYCTAWTTPKDFAAVNLLSTLDPGEQLPGIYQWSDRIRLPIDGTKLSRSLLNSDLYRSVSLYTSQRTGIAAGAIINGDKVFWQRRTDSLLPHAQIDASSGNAEKLNNFMLLDSKDLWDCNHQPFDDVWIPDAGDPEKMVRITFAAPADIAEIVLYDSPSPKDNILNAQIVFDNGYGFETGALECGGKASVFCVNQKGIRWFTIKLLATEGECAGLAEIEAFSETCPAPFSYIKLTNGDGHFVYDYIIHESGIEALGLHTFGEVAELSPQAYQVTCDRSECSASISEGKLLVCCPVGRACNITITSFDKSISDSVFIRNPTQKERKKIVRAQKTEEFFHRRARYIWRQTLLYRFQTNTGNYIHAILRRCKHFLLSLRANNAIG